MIKLLDRETLQVMATALAVAVFFLLPAVQENFIGYIAYRGLSIGDVLFHEMGHALFYWLFGTPAIPSILTAIGSDMAGGFTMELGGRSLLVQALALAGLVYGAYRLREDHPILCAVVVALVVVVIALSFTRYPPVVISYMGHGSAIVAGGVLLYRAWLNIIVRTGFERWCNALFGFFIVLNNAQFAYKLLYVPEFRTRYEEAPVAMDFVAIADRLLQVQVNHIAWFTLACCGVALVASVALASYFYEDVRYAD